MTDAPETDVSKLSFEEALRALEEVVGRLESGDAPLEESIELYERGAKLKAHCEKKLEAAELKVRQITEGPGGVSAEPVEIK